MSHLLTTDHLRVDGISKQYSAVYALRNATFAVRRGEIHALVGENGAGKSTLAKVIAGSVQPDAGAIVVEGKPVVLKRPRDAQRLGIGIVYQELDLFPSLTIAENIVIGNVRVPNHFLVSFTQMDQFCRPFLRQVGLDISSTTVVGDLQIAQTQLVAIARALSMNARLIVLDEPTSSLFVDSAERLFGLMKELRARGVSIVYVSHKMEEIFRVSDRITVLRDGSTVGTVETPSTNADEIIRMMVGREFYQAPRPKRRAFGAKLLSVSNLCTERLTDICCELRSGEVLGIAGLVGSGRSEFGAALFGLREISRGEVWIKGERIAPIFAKKRLRCRISLVPEDRKTQGLMFRMSVLENSTLASLKNFQRFGFLRQNLERSDVNLIGDRLALKCPSLDVDISALSGGNQQKVLLARALLVGSDIIFLDEPSRGIDVTAKQDIYRIIDDLSEAGKGVILVTSELPELLRCCDRILVFNQGRVTATYDASDATPEKILAAATRTYISAPETIN